MSHSTHVGFNLPVFTEDPTASGKRSLLIDRSRVQSRAWGVGHNEDSVTEVRGTKGCRWYAIPFRIVPDLGKATENSSHTSGEEPWDILHEDEAGS